jgi:hypothetical protein
VLCSPCLSRHNEQAGRFKGHSAHTVDSLVMFFGAARAPPGCPLHAGTPLAFVCNNDNHALICGQCAAGPQHVGHAVVPVSSSAGEARAWLWDQALHQTGSAPPSQGPGAVESISAVVAASAASKRVVDELAMLPGHVLMTKLEIAQACDALSGSLAAIRADLFGRVDAAAAACSAALEHERSSRDAQLVQVRAFMGNAVLVSS